MILGRTLRHQHRLLTATCSTLLRASEPSFGVQVCRSVHTLPSIGGYEDRFETGKEPVLSRDAYEKAWNQYQRGLVERLTEITERDATISTSWDPKQILMNTASDPARAAAFNYASMAFNNHFFFRCISATKTEMPIPLHESLVRSFGSIKALRDTFLATASGMFGPGFVWLVQDVNPSTNHTSVQSAPQPNPGTAPSLHFRILNTYVAGSPFPGAHARRQGGYVNTPPKPAQSPEEHQRLSQVQNTVGFAGRYAPTGATGMGSIPNVELTKEQEALRYGGANIIPLLCVNTWEHVWMHDYPLTIKGKRSYLSRWWDRIDWPEVWSNVNKNVSPLGGRTHGNRAFAI